MQVYRGIAALSDFRKSKLLTRLKKIDSKIVRIDAEYVHFLDVKRALSATDEIKLKRILTYGSPFAGKQEGSLFLVVPRPGTISPWSSKATDILMNCGLSSISRVERGIAYYVEGAVVDNAEAISDELYDHMTEAVLKNFDAAEILFEATKPKSFQSISVLERGKAALRTANTEFGLALTNDEIDYLYASYKKLGRNPTDIELMMFAQVNSEHCRHKIFNADWVIDGKKQPSSLFEMIKNTYKQHPENVLSAYTDNAAIIKGPIAGRFFSDPKQSGVYAYHKEAVHAVIKAETHNHPTAIAPIPGAATGTGGEIRDEAAAGRGAKSKMGLAGYSVSNLEIPNAVQPWEQEYGSSSRIASALNIMLEAPIGAAGFANEFGRPALAGYFRTFEQQTNETVWGYRKPIMIAGGLGNIRDHDVKKQTLPVGTLLIVLGGPAMLIGLGGGAAASMQSGASKHALDFASVQRGNGEMERRDQEVIDACWAMGDQNPIKSIHDVGAGGWSVSLTELVHDSEKGAVIELRNLPNAEPGLSPLQIWCNESQERYVLGIAKSDLDRFRAICNRERCPFAVVGSLTDESQLIVKDSLFQNNPIDISMDILLGKPPKMIREFNRKKTKLSPLKLDKISIESAIERVLHLPSVGSKKFLITIGDRTVGGLVTRDQLIGPWQVPVSDVAVSATAFDTPYGEAMAMGERTPLALINAPAAARIAVGEAVTNILAADIKSILDIKLSANWMAAVGFEHEDEKLFDAVKAVGEDFCPRLGLTIPVGKDSLSMRTSWSEGQQSKSVTSPVSLIISAFSSVGSVAHTLTPQLGTSPDTVLLYIDLGEAKNRLGGSSLAQVFNQIGDQSPDIDPEVLLRFFESIKTLRNQGKILAYHDRSDGGLLTTLLEMAFAARSGLDITLDSLPGTTIEKLFTEELGAVIQIRQADKKAVLEILSKKLGRNIYEIGTPIRKQHLTIRDGTFTYQKSRSQLEHWWSKTSYELQKMRDNPKCADQEFQSIEDDSDPGLQPLITFQPKQKHYKQKPKVAILREVGVNGQVEMAAAFDKAGFISVDVHLNDLLNNRVSLDAFKGLVACGGFSYGDVLGAGEGWAKSILFHKSLKDMFRTFFARPDSFSLGVCNGCQMLNTLKELIPGTDLWPDAFLKNTSEQFEGRLVSVKINQTNSIFFKDMTGSILPIPVAHGEGRAYFSAAENLKKAEQANLIVAQYVDNRGEVTEEYPYNPNGSNEGITAFTSTDGRATIIMPHPERVFQTRQLSWHPKDWDINSPWLQLFHNARNWLA